ncbi:MAG: hypothetical protein IJR13_07405 [Bacteroidales bacterium]|nr:hypothetical protein [Bacteroidales bacterium]
MIGYTNMRYDERLAHVFDNTATTYKFFWFLALLEEVVDKRRKRVRVWDMMVDMVVEAWNLTGIHKLSFGRVDSLPSAVETLKRVYHLPASIDDEALRGWLHEHVNDKGVQQLLRFLSLNVPYRFLSPWFDCSDYSNVVRASQLYLNGCPYSIRQEEGEMMIDVDEQWMIYLVENYEQVGKYICDSLAAYLTKNNPYYSAIDGLMALRGAKKKKKRIFNYWDFVISHSNDMCNVFTGTVLRDRGYTVEQFMNASSDIWHVWNSLSVEAGWQRSDTSARYPLLFFSEYAHMHQQAVRLCIDNHYNGFVVLDEYKALGCLPQEMAEMDKTHIVESFAGILIGAHSDDRYLMAAEN